MSEVYKMADNYYKRGLWSRERLEALVKAGRLTKAERDEIVKNKG